MSEQIAQELRNALDLIKAGKTTQARPILVDLLRRDDQLEQAWFLLSYTLPEHEKQVEALVKALELNPGFDKASERLAKLRADKAPAMSAAEPAAEEDAGVAENDSAGFADEGGDDEQPPVTSPFYQGDAEFIDDGGDEHGATGGGRRRVWVLGCLVILVVLLVAAALFGTSLLGDLFSGFAGGGGGGGGAPTATEGMRQLPPTWTPTPQEGLLATPQPEVRLLP